MHQIEPEAAPQRWPEPKVTGNSLMLMGYLGGRIRSDDGYRVIELGNPLIIENLETKNRYRISIEQISGQE